MLFEAREAIDIAKRILWNKHSAAATVTQQPCDLSPVFRLLKFMQARATAKDVVATGLGNTIDELFAHDLRRSGLNLDRNPRRKKALIDYLRCLSEMLEKTMTKENLQMPFVKAGMIDDTFKLFPTLDGLMATCKRWGSDIKNIGVSLVTKRECKLQFQSLAQIRLDVGQVSYADMHAAGIPRGKFLPQLSTILMCNKRVLT